jgi:hypothetical protein
MGNIISAVAVLLTHMLRKAQLAMTPATIERGLAPRSRMLDNAMRRGSPVESMARAMRNPPRNR